MKQKLRHPIFLAMHAAALVIYLLLPLYWKLSGYIFKLFGGCIMKRFLFLYCPLCGGTRAVMALARLDFVAAFQHNAFVAVAFFVILILDIVAWVRLFQKKQLLIKLPNWSWVAFAVAMIAYWILRNYLLIAYSIDPTGDLGVFWKAIRAYLAS